MQESKAVIISLHPEHANKILSGKKKLEFRRVWSKQQVNAVVIYATSPVKKIVAIGYVKQVHIGTKNKLWELAKSIGGGLSRSALRNYFEGKKYGFAIEFKSISPIKPALSPTLCFKKFSPPQSFAYLSIDDLKKIEGYAMNQQNQNNKYKTIFIAGIHGVGKTTMCQAYSEKHPCVHKSASQLIKEAKATAIEANSKQVKDIDGNQQILIESVNKIRQSGNDLLLDGHFAILNSENKPIALETNVFSDLGINAVIVISDDPDSITKRLESRDDKSSKAIDVTQFQNLEISRAKEVANELNLPVFEIKAFDQSSFDQIVSSL